MEQCINENVLYRRSFGVDISLDFRANLVNMNLFVFLFICFHQNQLVVFRLIKKRFSYLNGT